MESYIVSFITILILLAFYKLFEKLLPLNKAKYKTDKTIKELRKKYLKFDLIQIAVFTFLTVTGVYLLIKFFSYLIELRLSLLSDVIIIVKPGLDKLFLISILSGMLLSVMSVIVFSKQQLKKDWEEYLAYTNLKYKINYVRLSKYTLKSFAVITGILIIFFTDWYSSFGKNEIKINGLSTIGVKTYKYSDILKVKDIDKLIAPNGNIVEDPHYIIEFSDGENWNSRDNGFANDRKDGEIIDLVMNRTELEPIELEFDNE